MNYARMNLLPRVYMAKQDKREGGVMWSLCISTRYESDDSDSSLPCSRSSLGQLDLATDMTRQSGDEELSTIAGLVRLSRQLDNSALSLRTADLVTQLRGRKPGILRRGRSKISVQGLSTSSNSCSGPDAPVGQARCALTFAYWYVGSFFDRAGSLWKKQPVQLSTSPLRVHCFDLWPAWGFLISKHEWKKLPKVTGQASVFC